MTARIEEFIVGRSARVSLKVPAGSVTVEEGVPNEIRVAIEGPSADHFIVSQSEDTVSVHHDPRRGRSMAEHVVTISVPTGVSLAGSVASADISCEVELGDVRLVSASGDLLVDHATDVDLKTASGDVQVAATKNRVRIRTASGDVAIGVANDVSVVTASGDVKVGESRATATLKTASGELRVDAFDGPSLSVKTVSGDVHVGVRPGRSIKVDIQSLSGAINLPSEPTSGTTGGGPGLKVRARTVSGDINLATVEHIA